MIEGMRILIVEDDSNNAAYLANQLNKLAYKTIDFATSGEEAMARIENENLPDLIFMDIFLKGEKNGIDTALEIYSKVKIPIVFVSAPENLFFLEEEKFIKNPTFLSKPFDIEEIKKAIKDVNMDAIKKTPEYIEADRLNKVSKYEILDTPPEGNFDRITKLAAKLLGASTALISIVDEDRIWFKSRYGFKEKEIPRDINLFGSSFLSKEYNYYNKGHYASSFITPVLAHESGFQFFASSPLITADGHNLGVLCVIDKRPRQITDEEKLVLKDLAQIIMDEMEMRLAARKAYRKQRDFLNIAVHDLKNPLAAILGFSDLSEKEDQLKTLDEYNGYIKHAANNMLQIVEGLLKNSLMELDQVKLNCIPLHFSEIVDSVMIGNKTQAAKKGQKLNLNINGDPIITADSVKLGEALDNLVSNAIKYSPKEQDIEINVFEESDNVFFEVKDRGPGLTDDERNRAFEKFSGLSAQPTGGESSTGLGLSITKKLVELHGGNIEVQSEGKEKGATFIIKIPAASVEHKELLLQEEDL
ncbi:MAG: histidine kinase [Bacteroidetes bacterium]|jgi:signal transduction histidine kinase/CheY-like chemotaxis protein|nr:histidine kinase [Bacteroidota bacterium]